MVAKLRRGTNGSSDLLRRQEAAACCGAHHRLIDHVAVSETNIDVMEEDDFRAGTKENTASKGSLSGQG
jgi:hypothetical protein